MKNKCFLFVIIFSFLSSFEGDKHDYYLPNGLKVIIYEKHTHPTIALNIIYDVGSHDDPIGKKGLTHVMARLMEKGSKNYKSQEHLAIVESTGGYSEYSYWTIEDYLEFSNTSTSDNLELLLMLESDRMDSLLINSESVKYAKLDAISNIEENMQASVWKIFRAIRNTYPKNHPYSFNPSGNIEDIKTISIDDCQNTYNEYFTPNNAILVIVGDVDPIESFNLITKYFGDIKSSESLPKNPSLTFDATKNKDLDIFEVKNWPMNSYVEIFSIPTPQNKDFIVVDLLEEILNMRSSPYKKFVFDNDYFKEGFIYYNPKLGNGQFGFILESETVNTNFKKHEKAIKKTLKNLAKNGIEEAFLKVTINREKMDIYRVNSSVLWMAQMLARHEMKYGGYNTFFDNVQLYENITNEDIKRVVNKYFINGYKLVIKDKN